MKNFSPMVCIHGATDVVPKLGQDVRITKIIAVSVSKYSEKTIYISEHDLGDFIKNTSFPFPSLLKKNDDGTWLFKATAISTAEDTKKFIVDSGPCLHANLDMAN